MATPPLLKHEWYHRTAGILGGVSEVGPVAEAEFLALAMQGKLRRDSLVMSPTRTNGGWHLLPQIAGLAKALEDGEKSRQAEKEAAAARKAIARQETQDAKAEQSAISAQREQHAQAGQQTDAWRTEI